ncbi:DUF4435 domain-containing protein [Citrobacter amalonaticus]|uniref:DUF4435 domain-containing protein n=2 Tax=Citrobacter amalonaticus TaxID=35703 RepID=A0ABY0HUJ2_CITAM|nr:DUF4435 domain-containing protein [Citrobacter amalonaticus]MZK90402.1 DUF4435 domain-containing protein [Citrobacter amalonaticus]MZK94929.1 DUF4435 domain-containing protein [Citrobacter amalonaticus]MZL05111.1 DUF4435 domain-containing protein [Citrobacter amalonaticus]MZL22725.1 DUF4435 domain-containing protein [Citrobacter amalonaticus]MZL43552.1 DUF4435 domain-containing protein [Citrobacter amalonaticus]
MSEMSDIMRSDGYIRLYTSIASSGSQKGIIYIEDAVDRVFWEKAINAVCPDQYDIKPYSQPGAEGKRKLEREYSKLHKKLLVAIDADYDYICPDRNAYASELDNNPFILHTYFYSKESYIHTPEAIDYLTNSVHLNMKTEHSIHQALQRYSSIIFNALCLFSWLHNRNAQQYRENDFNQCIALPNGVKILNADLTVNEAALHQLTLNVENYMNQYSQHINDDAGFARHREFLSERGLRPDNSLLFTNGHTLLDSIFRPAYDMFIRKSRSNENDWVTAHYNENQVRDRKSQVRNHYDNNCKLTTMLHHCEAYQTTQFWQRITDKLSQIESFD